jgi:hypothetical protein
MLLSENPAPVVKVRQPSAALSKVLSMSTPEGEGCHKEGGGEGLHEATPAEGFTALERPARRRWRPGYGSDQKACRGSPHDR